YLVFIVSFSLLASTLPFIGLIPFAAYFALSRKYDCGKGLLNRAKAFFKDTFTVWNILGGGTVGILSFLYLKNNDAGQMYGILTPDNNKTTTLYFWFLYLLFLLLEVGVYIAPMFFAQKKNPLYYLTTALFVVFPLILVGEKADFCMRASLPALIILYFLLLDSLKKYREKGKKFIPVAMSVLLSVFLIIGAVTPIQEISRSVIRTYKHFADGGQTEIIRTNYGIFENRLKNFTGQPNDNIFFDYIAKK
ncbi:MAG: hypothetical protein K6F09_02865, partial [Clostridiales bacterium]|nr:hypothetical protein [Clostridiales bacterium]